MSIDGPSVEELRHGPTLVALIVRSGYRANGAQFFTEHTLSQQVGCIRRPRGHIIAPHVHNRVRREVEYTQEVLLIRSGRMQVELFDRTGAFMARRILDAGDLILLASGGHGFEMLEETEFFEIKQGPYTPDDDKTFLTTRVTG